MCHFSQDADDYKREGQAVDFYYTIDILDKENLSPKSAVLSRLEGNDAMGRIYNHIESYTGQELCMTDDGRYSTEPCTRSQGRMSTWQIVTVSIATIVVLGLLVLGIYMILRRRKREVKEQAYTRRYSQDRKKRKPHKSHRHSHQSHRHSHRKEKSHHHSQEKRRHRRSNRHNRSRHRSEYSDDSYDNRE